MNALLSLLSLSLLAAAPETQDETAVVAQPPWNVVVFVVDDLGFADIGPYGQEYVPTPNIDRIAAEGVRFTRAYSPAALSTPSRTGLMTGRYPQSLGVEFEVQLEDPVQGLPAEVETIGETFRAAGYSTAFVGKWGLGIDASHHPLAHGFDSFFGYQRDWRRYLPRPEKEEVVASWALQRDRELVLKEEFEHLEVELANASVRAIEAHAGRSLLLVHSFNGVRGPLQFRKDLGDEMRQQYRGLLTSRRTRMLALIASLDEAVGQVWSALEANGSADRTIVVFTADGGGRLSKEEPSDNGGLRGWSGELFEGGIHVPLLIRWPGRFEGGTTYEGLVSLLDVLPTVATVGGATPSDELDGVDLAPFIVGEKQGSPHETLYFRQGRANGALLTAEGKKIVWNGGGVRAAELFDITADRSEAQPIDDAEQRAALVSKWRVWSKSLPKAAWRRVKRSKEAAEETEDLDETAPAQEQGL